MLSASIVDELLQSGRRGTISKLADLCDGNLELQTEIEVYKLCFTAFKILGLFDY